VTDLSGLTLEKGSVLFINGFRIYLSEIAFISIQNMYWLKGNLSIVFLQPLQIMSDVLSAELSGPFLKLTFFLYVLLRIIIIKFAENYIIFFFLFLTYCVFFCFILR
jgi:hypothetical protein